MVVDLTIAYQAGALVIEWLIARGCWVHDGQAVKPEPTTRSNLCNDTVVRPTALYLGKFNTEGFARKLCASIRKNSTHDRLPFPGVLPPDSELTLYTYDRHRRLFPET